MNIYILKPMQQQYGGRQIHVWTLCAKSASAFLAVIRSDVFEKRAQLELALQLDKSNWQEVGPKMKAMRGNQL